MRSILPITAHLSPRRQRRILLLSCFILFFIIIALVVHHPSSKKFAKSTLKQIYDHIDLEEGDSYETSTSDNLLPCANLPGASDVLVIMKTGGTESHTNLACHLRTTFRCIPHYRIYSDLPESFLSHEIHDALDTLPASIVDNDEEFNLYRAMRVAREQGLNLSTLAHTGDDERNLGWDLDKWKFLPLVEKAYAFRPTAKWFVFIEADTFLMWSNLLRYLSFLDPDTPEYRGGPAWVDDDIFAHGGSGYILSAETVRIAVDALKHNASHYEMPRGECCGDLVLSKFLRSLGVHFTSAFPLIQGESLATLDYTSDKWSRPVISYHHVGQDTVEQVWHFEQRWLREHQNAQAEQRQYSDTRHTKPTAPILHRNIFTAFIAPLIYPSSSLSDWDNISHDRVLRPARLPSPFSSSPSSQSDDNDDNDDDDDDDDDNDDNDSTTDENDETSQINSLSPTSPTSIHAPTSLSACKDACQADPNCVQYSFRPGRCGLGMSVRLGGADSGGMYKWDEEEEDEEEEESYGDYDDEEEGGDGRDEEGEGKKKWASESVRMGKRSGWMKARIEQMMVETLKESIWWSEEKIFHTEN